MRQGRYLYILPVLIVLSVGALFAYLYGGKETIRQWSSVDRQAVIHPDYCGTVIPPNIAPLNFMIEEKGSCYFVKIYSRGGEPIEVFSRSPKIIIPVNSWHRLLDANRGEELYFDVFVKAENGQWNRFSVISNKIAKETIDGYLVYRKIHPVHSTAREMGIYQRNLENYKESLVLSGRSASGRYCVNCHTFLKNDTDAMLIHLRRSSSGPSMLLIRNGQVSDIDSRTQFGSAPIGHTVWHPSGRLIAFTVYKVRQFFHTARNEVRDVVDLDSGGGYYLFDSRILKTTANFSNNDRLETFPTWSPDGRYLYFCIAPILWSDREKIPPEHYKESKYDLVRMSYDLENDKWGELETVLSSKQTGLSVIQPRISPDGRFLVFCMCQYSAFPAFQPNSDLYIMDLSTSRYEKLACNSDQSESWHCWSSNGRWLAFSSKRGNGLFSRDYFSYIDPNGKASKPFVLPQKNAAFYDSSIELYQMPELVKSPVPSVEGKELAKLFRKRIEPLSSIPITSATPKAGSPAAKPEPWHGGME